EFLYGDSNDPGQWCGTKLKPIQQFDPHSGDEFLLSGGKIPMKSLRCSSRNLRLLRRLPLFAVLFVLTTSMTVSVQNTKKRRGGQQRTNQTRPQASSPNNQLAQALALVRAGQFMQAAPQLYALSRRPEFVSERMQIKYILGVCLMQLKM